MLFFCTLTMMALAPLEPADLTLWYTHPAADRTEASVVSNGRLTAAVFGGVAEDCIQINENAMGQPVADLLLNFHHAGPFSNYTRALDQKQAVATVSYRADNTAYKREAFATAADGVIVVRLESERPGALSFDAALSSPQMHSVRSPRANHVIVQGETGGPAGPFEAWLVVKPEGGTVESGGGSIKVEGADAATLIIAAGVGDHPDAACRQAMGPAVRKDYAQLIGDHLGGVAPSVKAD